MTVVVAKIGLDMINKNARGGPMCWNSEYGCSTAQYALMIFVGLIIIVPIIAIFVETVTNKKLSK
jgi:hypothetical protein